MVNCPGLIPGTRHIASLCVSSTTIGGETPGRSLAKPPRTQTCPAAGMEKLKMMFKVQYFLHRNDSQGSNSTQSTNTWRMSRSIVSGDFNNSIARTGSGYSDKFSALTQVPSYLLFPVSDILFAESRQRTEARQDPRLG